RTSPISTLGAPCTFASCANIIAENSTTYASIATTTASTQSANSTNSRRARARAASWAAKKSGDGGAGGAASTVSANLAEAYPHRLALLGRLRRERRRRVEAEDRCEDVVRELLDLRVVREHCVVVRLARERHLVLGRGQLLGERRDRLVGLQVRIGLDDREQAPERAGQCRILGGERLQLRASPRIGGEPLARTHGRGARADDR